jgi:hypothetical protein
LKRLREDLWCGLKKEPFSGRYLYVGGDDDMTGKGELLQGGWFSKDPKLTTIWEAMASVTVLLLE